MVTLWEISGEEIIMLDELKLTNAGTVNQIKKRED
jgi:hypothetical protein